MKRQFAICVLTFAVVFALVFAATLDVSEAIRGTVIDVSNPLNVVREPVGLITGTVTDGTKRLSNISVEIYDAVTNNYITSVLTNNVGIYTVGDLPAGNYKVHFNGSATGFTSEWYNDQPSITSANVVPVILLIPAYINAVLVPVGQISGQVTDGTTPLHNVTVNIYDAVTFDWITAATTDENGNYLAVGLPTGNYKVQFDGTDIGYTSEYYDNQGYASAIIIPVTAPDTTFGINAVLAQAGQISGQITDGTTPLHNVTVNIYDAVTFDWITAATTDENGNYLAVGLPTGNYKVQFDGTDIGYTSEYYDKQGYASAIIIPVTAPDTTSGINAVLAQAGQISGQVTDGTTPLHNVTVNIYDAVTFDWITAATTDENGNYLAVGLPTGNYKVQFDGTDIGYTSEYYDKQGYASAIIIPVTAPDTTSGINAVLIPAGQISGQVTDGTTPLHNVTVNIYDAVTFDWITAVTTDENGNYLAVGLPTGNYKVQFDGTDIGYTSEYYDKQGYASAIIIPVTAPDTTSGINAVLAQAGQISGQVTDGTTPLHNVTVNIYDAVTFDWITAATTDENGNYLAVGLPTGNYKVQFDGTDIGYTSEYYDKQGYASATTIEVSASNTTSNISTGLTPTIVMDVPQSASFFSYQPTEIAVLSASPVDAKPIGVGNIASGGNTLNININIAKFSAPVDVYLGIVIPSDPNNIYLLKPDKSFQLLSAGLIAWAENTAGPLSLNLFGELPASSLPKGTYALALLVTPAGGNSFSSYYLWLTTFLVN